MNELIKIVNLSKRFNDLVIFKNVNMTFYKTGLYGIKGESGSGKSTLLHILSMLDKDYEGDISFLNQDLKTIKNQDDFIKEHISVIEQNPTFINNMTVEDNLTLISKADNLSINQVLIKVNLRNKKKVLINKLSGGEKMRLAIARSILISPSIILCDEPTGSLNQTLSYEIMELLLKESKTKAVFIVSHDVNLLNQYVDVLYELKNKSINIVKDNFCVNEVENKKINNLQDKINLNFIFKYIKAKFKAKRIQSLLCVFSLVISLFTIGFSSFLKDEVSSSIKESFKTLIEDDQMYVKSNKEVIKNENISISLNEAEDIINNSSYFYDYNYLYIGEFEKQFKHANYMGILKDELTPFYEVGLRNIVECIDYDDIKLTHTFYPHNVSNLTLDEAIFGLRRRDIKKICNALKLQNEDYLTLSEYMKYHSVDFIFYFQNDDWGYKNELLIRMRSFFISEDRVILCHNDKNFVSDVIENRMKLPTSYDLNRIEYIPWTIKKATYIKVKKENEYEALKEYFTSYLYPLYDLEKVQGNLNSNFLSSTYHQGKYIVTYAGLNKTNYKDIENIIEKNEEIFPLDNSYPLIKEAMVSGFSNTMFFSSNKQDLDDVENYYSSLTQNADTLDLSLIKYNEGVTYGNLITAMQNKGVKLKTKKPKLKSGRYPLLENEIVISSSLAKKLFKQETPINKRMYLLFNNFDTTFYNQFEQSSLLICGVFEDDKEYIYQEAFWYYIFICLNFSYPLENINIDSYIYTSHKSCDELNKNYPLFTFENPLLDLCASVDSFMEMLNIVLIFFVVLLFISSFAILFITLNNVMYEAEKEIGLLKSLGFKKREIIKLYALYNFSYSIISITFSCFIIYILNSFLKYFIFNTSSFYIISYKPFLEIIIFGFLLSLLPCLLNIIIPLKKDTIELMKKYN